MAGEYQSCISVGGYGPGSPNYKDQTEDWNGATWSEVADLSTGRQSLGAAGSASLAVAFGGDTPSYTTSTEEWSQGTTVRSVDTD